MASPKCCAPSSDTEFDVCEESLFLASVEPRRTELMLL